MSLIKTFEGLHKAYKNQYVAYQCPAGVWTIGYGHTKDVSAETTASLAQINDWFEDDLNHIRTILDATVKVNLAPHQRVALESLIFNIGEANWRNSTALKRLNAGDLDGSAEAMTWWNKATINGQKQRLTGLVRRREAERACFLNLDPVIPAKALDPEAMPRGKISGGQHKKINQSKTLRGISVAALGSLLTSISEVIRASTTIADSAQILLIIGILTGMGALIYLTFNRLWELTSGEH